MKKAAAFCGLLIVTVISVALASAPEPMACDSWQCNGASCSPAKYLVVRNAPILPPLAASPVYGAALLEGGLLVGAVGLIASAYAARRRRERGGAWLKPQLLPGWLER